MVLHVNVSSNIAKVAADLLKIERQAIPFATVVAMTRTMQKVRDAEIADMIRVFDRPVPWTLNSVFLKPATLKDPVAAVGFKEFAPKGTAAGKYLKPQIEGGPRRLKRFERLLQAKGLLPPGMYAVPGKAAEIDGHGNMNLGQLVKILSFLRAFGEQGYLANRSRRVKSRGVRRGEQYFVGAPAGKPLGVWQRRGSTIAPVLIFVRPPVYSKRFPFKEVADRTIFFEFSRQLDRALMEAIKFKVGIRLAA